MASVDAIKELREMTSCGVIECKKALEEAKGDIEKAKQILQKRGLEIAAKKGSRTAKEGRVESYIHLGNKIGVIVEVNCETDFVAKNEDFCAFTKDVAMHIAAMAPKYIKQADIPADVLAAQKDQATFIKENCLLDQPFVRDPKMTIQDCLNLLIAKIGENILVSRFIRYKVGVE
ncbi:MAG: translation elongation factor Ts [Omnitrophica WOR_2 bacterium RIFCSPHIGHO2_01_FULL_48_9]|nr:MAG: translation elongation factor Ts [Omnitrophica WOR_2 bacterium RIFCSPHIGHO2_02_FULL_48_11]OGX34518.1 MAG: translation elongation factor Ts [Omnitrophica WOR_2 bacterium RIFCSPHIGHO2_01_FULL_48_9]